MKGFISSSEVLFPNCRKRVLSLSCWVRYPGHPQLKGIVKKKYISLPVVREKYFPSHTSVLPETPLLVQAY